MTYKIDGVDISTFGAFPYIEKSKECIALSGVFNLPKRTGTTEYNWGVSIEPYVDASDIELDDRTLKLRLVIKGHDYISKVMQLRLACIACRKLWTEFGEFDVMLKDGITVDEYVKQIGRAHV